MALTMGKYQCTGIPIKLDRTPGAVRLPPPGIGEHSTEVLQRFGFSDEEISGAIHNQTIQQKYPGASA